MWRRWLARRAGATTPWRDLAMLVVDFETTGVHPRRAHPLSVGWVPVRGGRIVLADAGYRRIRPDGAVPTGSMGIHGLLPEDLASAAPTAVVGDELRSMLNGHLLVAHGATIEVGMLHRCGIDHPRGEVIDTLGLTRSLDRRTERTGDVRLGAAAARYGVPVHRPHHAFGDALTTAGLLLALATGLEGHGAGTRGSLVRLSRLSASAGA